MRWFAAYALAVLLTWPLSAAAAVPPFELVQKSVAQTRSKGQRIRLDLRITETGKGLAEWPLKGLFEFNAPAGQSPTTVGPSSRVARKLLWIAVLAADPIAELTRDYGFVNGNRSTVGVQRDFVYVYGQSPKVSVYRDLKRLAAFMVSDGADKWIARLSWDGDLLTGIMITRNGKSVLTARTNVARPRDAAETDQSR